MIPIAKPLIGDEERAAVDRVLRSGGMAQGPEVEAFEKEFSSLVDGRHCVAVNSGTSALHLALVAHGDRSGRRGDRAVVLVRGDRQRRLPCRRDARSSSTSNPTTSASPEAVEAAVSARTVGDHAGAPLRPPGRHGPR